MRKIRSCLYSLMQIAAIAVSAAAAAVTVTSALAAVHFAIKKNTRKK